MVTQLMFLHNISTDINTEKLLAQISETEATTLESRRLSFQNEIITTSEKCRIEWQTIITTFKSRRNKP